MRAIPTSSKKMAFIILFLLICIISVFWLQVVPYDYDEFFNLQIPKNIIQNGIYATYYDSEYHPFDPMITSGVSMLLPMTLFLKILGVYESPILIPRYLMFIYFITTCLLLYIVSKKLFNDNVALISFVGMVFIPGILPLSLKVLGEIPATLYFLIGFFYLIKNEIEKRHLNCLLAGFFFALAILSKLIFIVLIGSALLYFAITRCKMTAKIIMAISFLTTLLIWEIYKVLTLGFTKYWSLRTESYYASMIQGAPIELVSASNINEKISILSNVFGLDKTSLIVILIICIIFYLYLIFHGLKNLKSLHVMYVSFVLLSSTIWFLFMARPWFRYITPYIILSIPIIVYLITILYNEMRKTNNIEKYVLLLAVTFFVLSIITSVFHIAKQNLIEYELYQNATENQKRFIQDIQRFPSESTIGYWGWWKAPEISYFVENDFVDLSGLNSYGHFKRGNVSSDFVVVSPYQISIDKGSIEMLSPLFGDKIFEECDVYKDCYYLYKFNSSSTMRYNFSSQYP